MKLLPIAALAGAMTLLAPPPSAHAFDTVIGEGLAHQCAQAAFAGLRDDPSLALCTLALDHDALADADMARTLLNRAVIQMNRGAWEACRADLAAAERLTPKLGEIYVDRGALYIHDRNFQGAIEEIDRGLALAPSEPEKAYYNRAMAREGLHDARGAYFDYRKASELNPKWPEPGLALARFSVARAAP